jgi:hypothetical protein
MKRACPRPFAAYESRLPLRQPSSPRPHSDLTLAYLKVARTAAERALRAADCPDLRHLVRTAEQNLAAAHDLLLTDCELAA